MIRFIYMLTKNGIPASLKGKPWTEARRNSSKTKL